MTDCLIIGFNDSNFEEYVKMVSAMGTDSGAWRDLNLAFIEYNNKPYRSMDILNHFYQEGKTQAKPLHNADFIWPVVLYLGTYLHRKGFSFDYVNLFHLEKDKLRDKLLYDDILTVAITTTLYVSSQPILEIISFIRQYNDKVKIVVGGPYINNQAKMIDRTSLQQLFKYIGADLYVISQEGEKALGDLIATLKSKTSLDQVDNISYRQGDSFVLTATSIESNPLEENMVDYSLFPRDEIGEFISIRTAKSCPFSCAFCGFPQRAGKYTYTPVELVEKQLNELRNLGITTITYLDDTFNVPKQRFQEILKMMIRNKYEFKWNSFYRSDHGDEQTIELMARAGCEGVFLGVESGSDTILKNMNKTSRRKNYMAAIPLLQAAGISAHANLIFGFPGETYQTIEESISLIEDARPDFFRTQLWYADPVTPIWDQRETYGIKGEAFSWKHNSMDCQVASDLIDKAFLSLQNSDWMPQYGFEQWSTFYLQRKGMTRTQVKAFIKCFNTAVKEKLINPGKKEINPVVWDNLRRSCQFDREQTPALDRIEILSAAEYRAAERFWIDEFSGLTIDSNLDDLCEKQPEAATDQTSIVINLDHDLAKRLIDAYGTQLESVVLAAYSILLSRLSGHEDAVIVLVADQSAEAPVIPLRLTVKWSLRLNSFLSDIQSKLRLGRRHGLYGFPILTNPWRLAEYGVLPPMFDVGYYYSQTGSPEPGSSFETALELLPDLRRKIKLILRAIRNDSELRLSYSYRADWFSPETVTKLNSYLSSILLEVSRNSDLPLGSIAIDSSQRASAMAIENDVAEEFNF